MSEARPSYDASPCFCLNCRRLAGAVSSPGRESRIEQEPERPSAIVFGLKSREVERLLFIHYLYQKGKVQS